MEDGGIGPHKRLSRGIYISNLAPSSCGYFLSFSQNKIFYIFLIDTTLSVKLTSDWFGSIDVISYFLFYFISQRDDNTFILMNFLIRYLFNQSLKKQDISSLMLHTVKFSYILSIEHVYLNHQSLITVIMSKKYNNYYIFR